MRLTFLAPLLLLLVLTGCTDQKAEERKKFIPPPPLPKSWEILREGDFVDAYQLSGADAGITVNPLNNTSPFSNCLFRWADGKATVSFRIEHNTELGKNPTKFKDQLTTWLQEGEAKNPKKPDYGEWTYVEVEGVGDMAIWSDYFRALKWVVGNEYYLFLNRNQRDRSPLSAEEELAALKELAQRINQRLPKTAEATPEEE